MAVELREGTLHAEITDPGTGFDPSERDEMRLGGWGLVLVERVSDRWGIREGGPTRVWFELDDARVRS